MGGGKRPWRRTFREDCNGNAASGKATASGCRTPRRGVKGRQASMREKLVAAGGDPSARGKL